MGKSAQIDHESDAGATSVQPVCDEAAEGGTWTRTEEEDGAFVDQLLARFPKVFADLAK